jgi:hypothetical protein
MSSGTRGSTPVDRKKLPHIPYEVIENIMKKAGFPTEGDPCIAPERNGKKCPGLIEFDRIMRRHRCKVCGYGF